MTHMPTPEALSVVHKALLGKDYLSAIRLQVEMLIDRPTSADVLSFNLSFARRAWRRERRNHPPRVAVCGWELSHNAAGRVRTLADLWRPLAETEIIGATFPRWGDALWAPIRASEIPCHMIHVADEAAFPRQALEHVLAHPYDIVHLSKPRFPNILFGLLYKLIWDAHVILDIDDEELGAVGAETTLALESLLQTHGGHPRWEHLGGKDWTRAAVGLWDVFDGTTVSNPALQARYGGPIIAHARAAEQFSPSPERRRASRARLNIPQDKTVVLFFGTPRRHKGLLETAQAIAALGRDDLCYVVAGGFPDPKLKDELAAIEGADIRFLPNQPYDNIADVVALGDICVLLQRDASLLASYQMPAKMVDALAMGLLVLAQPTPAFMGAIKAGAVVESFPNTLTDTLARWLDDPEAMRSVQARGRAYFLDHLEAEHSTAPLKQIVSATPTLPAPDILLQRPAQQQLFEHLGGWHMFKEARQVPEPPASSLVTDIQAAPGSEPQGAPALSWAGVDIIIPVYNALEDVRACLSSLVQVRTALRQRLIVVNDGSDQETSRLLRDFAASPKPPNVRVELIEHPENRGYTKSVNTGLRAATAPFAVTLNSDTIVTDEWLEGLIRCMRSDHAIGICGPLSNAASWQNVPDLYGPDKAFAINTLPEGLDADGMAGVVRRASLRSYPRTTFVNGFCFMIRREVIDQIGVMDEEAFPMGYGEENDFCIRAQDAGFALAYADDVYVFHAKSKSFGSVGKKQLSKQGSEAIHRKHGSDKFNRLVAEVKKTHAMDAIRARIRATLAEHEHIENSSSASTGSGATRICFLLPVRGGGGGAHSVVQEVAELRRLGVDAKVAVREKYYEEFTELYGDIPDSSSIFLSYSERKRVDLGARFDTIVATIFTSVRMVAEIVSKYPKVKAAYYVQDYEPWFFPADDPSRTEALESYTLIEDCVLFAKTDWIRNQVALAHGVYSAKVSPSIDHKVYSPRMKSTHGTQGSPIRLSAMIRPRTPRRGAGRTMELFARLHATFGDRLELTTFGCDTDDEGFKALRRDFPFHHRGILRRSDVAALLQQTDIFVDMSDYQAFGRTSLEAMACGATALVPQAGGADEYAVDGVNALVADTLDVAACQQALSALIARPDRLRALQLAALQTAASYSARRAAVSELAVLVGYGGT